MFDWEALAEEFPGEAASSPDDIEDVATDAPPEVPDDWPRCEICADPVTWSGRGRKPKKCDVHKMRGGNASAGSTGRIVTRRSSKHTERLAAIQTKLASQGVKTGALLSRFAPYTGLYLAQRSDKVSAALVSIAADKPEWLDALEQAAAFEAYFELAEFLGGLIVAAGVDTGRVHPESFPAKLLGVTEIHAMLADDQDIPQESYSEAQTTEPRSGFPVFGPGKLPAFTPIGDVG